MHSCVSIQYMFCNGYEFEISVVYVIDPSRIELLYESTVHEQIIEAARILSVPVADKGK